jgi:dTMP kinase
MNQRIYSQEPSAPGKLIVFEGIDFAGKTTQITAVQKILRRQGISSEKFRFPERQTPIGRLISRVLRGKVYIPDASLFALFSANRLEMREHLLRALRENEVVLCDRYCGSEHAYGGAKGLEASWLRALESLMPPADLIFLLDIDARAASQRSRRGVVRDTFEVNEKFLDLVRSRYLRLAKNSEDEQWILLDATLPRKEISETIISVLFQARAASRRPSTKPEA